MSDKVKCCLCFRCLTDSTSRKKRKKLHSDTCSQSKRILEELLLSTKNARLSDFLETKSGDAYLCYQCDGKATSLHKLQQRGTEVQNELVDKLKELHAVTATGPRKRLYVNVQNSADKRPRLDSQCDQHQIPETSETSSNQLHLEHHCANSGDLSTSSELHNAVESESNQELHSPTIKSKSPALSVSINIVEITILLASLVMLL